MDELAVFATLVALAAFGSCALFLVILVRQSRSNHLAQRVAALERDAAEQRALLAKALAEFGSPPPSVRPAESPARAESEPQSVASKRAELFTAHAARAGASMSVPAPSAPLTQLSAVPQLEPGLGAPPEHEREVSGVAALVREHTLAAEQSADVSASPPARTRVEWEQWFGIKGAALVGGAILALAGLLFVQYSIERGWLGPQTRCVLAAVGGLAALLGSSGLRRRGFVASSDALAGAGVTVLIGAAWAAYALYELIPFTLAFFSMAATTASCGFLALRRSSQTIAWFGLVGGFATPLLLSLGDGAPIGLFLYLLGLDVAVLALVRRRAWPKLAVAAAVATQLLFAFWIALHFEPRDASFALLFLGGVALVFSAARGAERASAASWIGSIAPFVFAAHFAGRSEFGVHVHPIAALLLVLTIAAAWLARRQANAPMQTAAGVGAGASLITWLASHAHGATAAHEAALAAVGLGLAHVLSAELARRRAGQVWTADAAALALAPVAAVLLFGAARLSDAPLVPWLLGAVAFALGWLRLARVGARATWSVAAEITPFVVYSLWRALGGGANAAWTVGWGDAALVTALATAAALVAWNERSSGARRATALGVLVVCVLALLERSAVHAASETNPSALIAILWSCALLGVLAARQAQAWVGYAAISAAAWLLAMHVLVLERFVPGGELGLVGTTLLLGLSLAAAPVLDANSARSSRNALRASALVLVLWESAARRTWHESAWAAHHEFAALLYLLAGLFLAARLSDQRLAPGENGGRSAASTGFVWLCIASAFLAAKTVDRIEADKQWTLAASVFLAATAWTAGAARHTGVRWIVAAAGAGTGLAVLSVAAEILRRGALLERTGWPVWHELSYLVGAPAIALFAAAWFTRESGEDLEAPRWSPLPWLSGALSLAAVLTTFLWLNIEVVNVLSDGAHYAFEWVRRPQRDVALSVAWTCYALTLLIVGMRLDRSALRWTSLVFFLATIAKVFLYDLGELRGLHRVGSLVGLALALLSVSVLYQRLVFRARSPAAAPLTSS